MQQYFSMITERRIRRSFVFITSVSGLLSILFSQKTLPALWTLRRFGTTRLIYNCSCGVGAFSSAILRILSFTLSPITTPVGPPRILGCLNHSSPHSLSHLPDRCAQTLTQALGNSQELGLGGVKNPLSLVSQNKTLPGKQRKEKPAFSTTIHTFSPASL